jgi:hypothetical protein
MHVARIGLATWMGRAVDALELMTALHAEIELLFAAYTDATTNRASAFTTLADRLIAHALVEEALFYPNILAAGDLAQIGASVADQRAARRIVVALQMIDPAVGSEMFEVQVAALRATHAVHARRDEGSLFPRVASSLGEEQLAALGEEMLATLVGFERQRGERVRTRPYVQA